MSYDYINLSALPARTYIEAAESLPDWKVDSLCPFGLSSATADELLNLMLSALAHGYVIGGAQ